MQMIQFVMAVFFKKESAVF